MATNNTNRQNGVRGAEASRKARHVSRFLNKRLDGRVNGRDAVLVGIQCKQYGPDVVVSVGHYPNPADQLRAEREAADLLTLLREDGYEVELSKQAGHRMWVTGHPRWSK